MLLIRHPEGYAAERSYTFGVVFSELLGLQWRSRPAATDHVEIALAGQEPGPSLRVAEVLFAIPEAERLTGAILPRTPLPRWRVDPPDLAPALVEPVPVLFGRRTTSGSYLQADSHGLTVGLDLFGAIFFQLTRAEELVAAERDEHERFPLARSLAHREGFLQRPLVDEYVELLRGALRRCWPRLEPRRSPFSLSLSHDVDWPLHPSSPLLPAVKQMGGDLLDRRDPGLAAAKLRARRARRRGQAALDPYYEAFDFLLGISEDNGLRSAFYFIPGRTDARFDPGYRLEDEPIRALMARVHERGHEVGLHPSYGTFRDPAALRAERDALLRACDQAGIRQPRWGGRQHFLRWENPTTWRIWDQARLDYDSSLGFSQGAGFRCGTCSEYPVFDLLDRRPLNLRERPLVAMDMALAGTRSEAAQQISALAGRCRRLGGALTILWHNSQLASPRQRRRYAAVVAAALSPGGACG